ncbi:MAG: glycoside hydrolase family 97 catalytic domain-containing protein [Verrucomicrobiota bacterium JB023]|nr:glycoside hydrolase family 97 catalytic domain-containing protein [Verrucomicrobiota bacterium JB023]
MNHSPLRYFPFLALSVGSLDAAYLSSPDERIEIETREADGVLTYSVKFQGKPIIDDSRLGVALKGGAFSGGLAVTGSEMVSHDETWEPVWGQTAEYRDHYHQLTLDLVETGETKREMKVIFRAYNDGIGFRYHFPAQEGLSQVDFAKELSQVSIISESPVAWYPKGSTTLFSEIPFEKLKKSSRTPFTIQASDDCFLSLHEAGVVNSSDAMLGLGKDQRTLTYSCSLKQKGEVTTPWRSIQIASSPAGLIESSLILNLNEPNKLEDTSWIEPGVSLWDWRNHGGKADDGFVYGINTESYLRYIDYAAEKGLAYLLIDAEWYGDEHSPETDPVTYEEEVNMPKIADYAKEKGVGLWLYINDKALKNFDLDRTFSQYRDWGVKGIKHGFLGGGNQVKNAYSVKILEKCAEYQIMYVLHEPNKPTGLTRTYPHYMSSEYVNSMLDAANRPPATPSEIAVFPVVHNLAGPVDRSCGLFDMDQSIERAKVHKQIPSTVVSQTAQCLLFPSGILTLPDMPDAYERKSDLFTFIQHLPMDYDESKVLAMEIGKHVTMARRAGDTWFVASVADESGHEQEITLDFLDADVTYAATLYEDTAESHYEFPGGWNKGDAKKKGVPFRPVETKRELYQVREMEVKKGDVIAAKLAPGGGHCLLLKPKK